jgi:hypothetical protein
VSGKSSAPNLARPELLNLKLRALFGVGARADLLFTLLAWPDRAFVASDLTTTGYSKRNIALVLEWFGNAGLLTDLRRGNRLEFSWQRRPQLVELVQPLPRYFPQWPELLRVWSWLLQLVTENESRSAPLARVATSKLLGELQQELHRLKLSPPQEAPPDWLAVQDWIVQEARRLEQGTSPSLRARTAPGHK